MRHRSPLIRTSSLLFLAVAIVQVAGPARAVPITFAFTATVTSVTESDTTVFTNALPVGSTITGEYTFEVTVTDTLNGNSAKKGDPDTIEVIIRDGGGTVIWSTDGTRDLTRGNIKVH